MKQTKKSCAICGAPIHFMPTSNSTASTKPVRTCGCMSTIAYTATECECTKMTSEYIRLRAELLELKEEMLKDKKKLNYIRSLANSELEPCTVIEMLGAML